ncbi:hypothetical protein F2Q70_00027197 [Brassica cretica]|uniref:DUF4283 domain-containing protein n=1 Tax=Brassica cretica TaxID=69181 RepID=A0A8S9L5U9_BRACR|nr:hypothetical protein F2Q70_00027197 [Brassica cretica]
MSNPPPHSSPNPVPTLVEKLRRSEDKTLHRLALVTIAASGRPRVLIPDSVFKKGEEIHKDFIVCYFNGRPPPFNQIQSVFNHMWGKGKKLEIHNNPLTRSAIVRIQTLWTSDHSSSSPPLQSVKLWAHLTGVPLDLHYQQCLSLVAGLVGEPKETDDFTKNLVSLTLSHVKIELDLTVPAPSVVEFERESGEVVEVYVTYPWLPPTCSHCKELGHVIRNCLKWTPPKDKQPVEKQATKQSDKAQGKKPVTSNDTPASSTNAKETVSTTDQVMKEAELSPPDGTSALMFSSLTPSSLPLIPTPTPKSASFSQSKSSRLAPKTPSHHSSLALLSPPSPDPFHLSPPGPHDRRVLKRSRSDPSISSPPLYKSDTTILPKGVTDIL